MLTQKVKYSEELSKKTTKRAYSYYLFGMHLPKRNNSAQVYRFGFNGKENDNEVAGAGNWQDYGERMYSPRLGRFPSPDPLIIYEQKYPWYSPFQFAGNKPIAAIDLDGLEELIQIYNEETGKTTVIKLKKAGELGHGILTINITGEKTTAQYMDPFTINAETGEVSGGEITNLTPKQLGELGLSRSLLSSKNVPDNIKVQVLQGSMRRGSKEFMLNAAELTGGILEEVGDGMETAGRVISLVPGGQAVGGALVSVGGVASSIGSVIQAGVIYKKGDKVGAAWKIGETIVGYQIGKRIEKLEGANKISKTDENILQGIAKGYEKVTGKIEEKITQQEE